MDGTTQSKKFLDVYDQSKITWRYWLTFFVLLMVGMFDFFDFFVVGYIVAVVGPRWHLTYGQSTTILIGAGVGAIIGSLLLGNLSDIFGRKKVVISGSALTAIAAGMIAFIPEHAWILFALLRILVGAGLGGTTAVQGTYIVELTPTRYRTFLSSIAVAPASMGMLLAALSVSNLYAHIGWRGLAALGFVPLILSLALFIVMVESPRWLVSRGRFGDARAAAATQMGVESTTLPLPSPDIGTRRSAPLSALFHNPRAFWLIMITWLGMSSTAYGYQAWGPTILALTLGLPVKKVASYFIVVAISGIIGRFVFSILPIYIGRRHSGEVMGFGAAIFILAAGYFHSDIVAGYPVFVIFLTAAVIFVNGGFSNMGPYAAESYPVEVAGRASGLSQAANGIGKILGPLVLGLIAGVNNLVAPKITQDAVVPGFIFLAACSLIAGLAYRFLPIETNKKQLALNDPT